MFEFLFEYFLLLILPTREHRIKSEVELAEAGLAYAIKKREKFEALEAMYQKRLLRLSGIGQQATSINGDLTVPGTITARTEMKDGLPLPISVPPMPPVKPSKE